MVAPHLHYSPGKSRLPANRWVYGAAGLVVAVTLLMNIGLVAYGSRLGRWDDLVFALLIAPLTNLITILVAVLAVPLLRIVADGAGVRPYVLSSVLVPLAGIAVDTAILWPR